MNNLPTNSFPVRPSEVFNNRPLSSNAELPKIRRNRWFALIALILVPTIAVGIVALDIKHEWSRELNRNLPLGLGLYFLGAAVSLASIGTLFQYAFGGWRDHHERCRRAHLNENVNHVAKHICEMIGSNNGYYWSRPANWGDAYMVITGGNLILMNFAEDWIRYLAPEYLRDIHYECRRVGTTTQSESRAHTFGAGYYLFTSETSVKSTGKAVDSYKHIIDIYSSEEGVEHLYADFGENETLAKDTYSRLLPLVGK